MCNAFNFIEFSAINKNIKMQNFKRLDCFNCKNAFYYYMHFADCARFTVDNF